MIKNWWERWNFYYKDIKKNNNKLIFHIFSNLFHWMKSLAYHQKKRSLYCPHWYTTGKQWSCITIIYESRKRTKRIKILRIPFSHRFQIVNNGFVCFSIKNIQIFKLWELFLMMRFIDVCIWMDGISKKGFKPS